MPPPRRSASGVWKRGLVVDTVQYMIRLQFSIVLRLWWSLDVWAVSVMLEMVDNDVKLHLVMICCCGYCYLLLTKEVWEVALSRCMRPDKHSTHDQCKDANIILAHVQCLVTARLSLRYHHIQVTHQFSTQANITLCKSWKIHFWFMENVSHDVRMILSIVVSCCVG